MSRPRIDFLSRITPSLSSLDPNECWEWLGPCIETNPGTTRKDGLAHHRAMFKGEAGAEGVMVITNRTVHPYRSPQIISYLGEMVQPIQALFHHFIPEAFGPDFHLPGPRERALAREYLAEVRRGAIVPTPENTPMYPPLPEIVTRHTPPQYRAMRGMFEGITISPAIRCQTCFGGRPREGGLKCMNPWHANRMGDQPGRTTRTAYQTPSPDAQSETVEEVSEMMEEFLNRKNLSDAPLFMELFQTEDRTEKLFQDALALTIQTKDISKQWKTQLSQLSTGLSSSPDTPTA